MTIISPPNIPFRGEVNSPPNSPLGGIYTVPRETYYIDRMKKKGKSRKPLLKPIQGHYGLEFALAHMGEDLSVVFKHLARRRA